MGCTVSERSGVATSTTAPERGCSRLLGSDTSAATVAAALQRIKRSAITLALKPKDAVLLAMGARQRSPKRARALCGRSGDPTENVCRSTRRRAMWFSKPQEPKSPPSRGQTWFSKPKEPKSPLAKDIQKYGVEQSTALARERARRGLQVLREEKQHASTKVALAASEAARAKMEMKSAVAKAELKTVQVRATSATTAVQREHKKIRNARLKRVLIMADGQALARTLANWRLQANVQAARRRVAVTSAAAKETNFWSSLFGGDQKEAGAAAPPRRRAVRGRRGQIHCARRGRPRGADAAEALHRWHRASGARKRPPRTRGRRRRSRRRRSCRPRRRAPGLRRRRQSSSRLATGCGSKGGGAGTVGGSPHRRRDGGAALGASAASPPSVSSPRSGDGAAALEFALADRLRAALKERSRPGRGRAGGEGNHHRAARARRWRNLAEERHGAEPLRLRLRHAEAHQRNRAGEELREDAISGHRAGRDGARTAARRARGALRSDASRRHLARWHRRRRPPPPAARLRARSRWRCGAPRRRSWRSPRNERGARR